MTSLRVVLPLLCLFACGESAPSTPARVVPRLADATDLDPDLRARIEEAARAAESGARADWVTLAEVYDANQLWEHAARTYALVPPADDPATMPSDAVLAYHLGRTLAASGADREALAALDRSIAAQDDYAPSHWRRGDLLFAEGRLEEAQAAFERALELGPRESPGALGLARVHLARGEARKAAKVLQALLEKNPKVSLANGLLARAYRQLGREDRAEKALRREDRSEAQAVSDPWTAGVLRHAAGLRVQLDRAGAALRAGDARTALQLMEPLYEREPSELSVVDLLAQATLALERPGDALRLLDTAPVADRDHFRLSLTRGRALAASGRVEDALRELTGSAERNPRYAESWRALGEVQLRLDRPDAAETSFARAIEEGQDSVRTIALLARARLQQNELDTAIEALEAGLEDYPNAATLWAHLADAQARAGRTEEARASLERVLEREPDHELIETVRARLRGEEGP